MIQFEKFTFAELHAMSGSDLEQYAERGAAFRSDLSRGVVHYLSFPNKWLCDMENGCEFGGGAPVNIRLTLKSQMSVTLCLASSSDDVPHWRMNLPFNGGASVAWLYCAETFDPEYIFYILQRVERLVSAGITTPERLAVALHQTGGVA